MPGIGRITVVRHALEALAALLVTAAVAARPQSDEPIALDPFEVRSPSGTFTLHVDPSSADGTGSATYTLARGESELWTKRMLLTLGDARVGDDGTFAGTAVDSAWGGGEGLHLLLFSVDGTKRFDETLPRDEGTAVDGPAFPLARGVAIHTEFDRAVFRIAHLSPNAHEEWRWVRASTGTLEASRRPADALRGTATPSFTALAPVRGVPLLVAHAERTERRADTGVRERGAVFALFDLDGRVVWQLDLPGDYEGGLGERALRRMRRELWGRGALLECAEPRRFAIASVREAQRVTFEVAADPAHPGAWSVREVGRDAYELASKQPEPAYPPLALELVGELALDAGAMTTAECAFIDASGRILLADDATHAVHVFDPAGKPAFVCPAPPRGVDAPTRITCIAVAPDGSIHLGEFDDPQRAYRVFDAAGAGLGTEARAGTLHFLPEPDATWLVHADSIVLTREEHGRPTGRSICLSRGGNASWLIRIDASAVAADGSLVVSTREHYHVFGPTGESRASVERPARSRYARLALSKSHVFACAGGTLWRTALRGPAIETATLDDALTKRSIATPFWRDGSNELWIVDGTAKKILRYRVGE